MENHFALTLEESLLILLAIILQAMNLILLASLTLNYLILLREK